MQMAFVYEEFMEYTMARSLLRDGRRRAWMKRVSWLRLTSRQRSTPRLLKYWVMVYVGLTLREERGLVLRRALEPGWAVARRCVGRNSQTAREPGGRQCLPGARGGVDPARC